MTYKYKVNLPIQDTGKVAKSTGLATLIEHADQRAVNVTAYDFDCDHRSLTNLYPDVVVPVEVSDQIEGDILRVLSKLKPGLTIVDPRAHMKRPFVRALKETGYLDSPDHRFTVWLHPQDIIEVMADLQDTVACLGNKVDWVVVKNRGRARSFRMFEHSELEAELIASNAGIIEIPSLLQDTVNHLSAVALRNDRVALPYREAIANAGPLGFQLGHAGFLQTWLRTVFWEYDRVAEQIYLPDDAARIRASKSQISSPVTSPPGTPPPGTRQKVNKNID